MGGFFNMDGPFFRIGNFLADVIILSLVWFVCSLPVVTMGASTTAVFYVATKRVSNKEGYLLRDFWKSFRTNFVQATLVWLLILLVGSVLGFNISHLDMMGRWKNILLPFQLCFVFELILVFLYVFPILARFEMKLGEAIKTALFMGNKHLLTSLACLLTMAAVVFACIVYPLFVLVSMGVYAFSASYFLVKLFKKYRPEMDRDDNEEWL